VDGRNPAPVDREFIPLSIGFPPSKVQDFFHLQYDRGIMGYHGDMSWGTASENRG
jgi:hypothetical protein